MSTKRITPDNRDDLTVDTMKEVHGGVQPANAERSIPSAEMTLSVNAEVPSADIPSAENDAHSAEEDERYLRMLDALRAESPRPTSDQLRAELAYETEKKRYRSTLRNTVWVLIVVAAAAVLMAVFLISVLRVRGDSMSPNLDEGDLVVAIRTSRFDPGDIVAFYYGPSILLKRVVGSPGDVINIDDDGNVYVNGVLLEEDYLFEKDRGDYADITYPFQVPDKRYFVLGDNRKESIDSRSYEIGTVERDQVVGKVIGRVWPLGK